MYIVPFSYFLVLSSCISVSNTQQFVGECDKAQNANLPFCDSSLSFDERLEDLLSRIPLDEQIGMLPDDAHGSPSANLEPYFWWGEALHGVAFSPSVHFRPPTPFVTVFPQIISLSSSFNKELFYRFATATGNEARALYNVGNAGLTFWSPNVNIFRDPRWGRGQETPGEDPYLTSQYALEFIKGLEGPNDREFIKVSACCKHYYAHSQEENRNSHNVNATQQDLADTYLPAFRTCVEEAGVTCIMCAYNRVNGIPACGDKQMLEDTLRGKWGFDGYIVSDCGAVSNIQYDHHYTNTTSDTVKLVLDAGLGPVCDQFLRDHSQEAVTDGSVTPQQITRALAYGHRTLFRAGHYEKNQTRPYLYLTPAIVNTPEHQALALETARQSIVLLKNGPAIQNKEKSSSGQQKILPLDRNLIARNNKVARFALIGPHYNITGRLVGNYNGQEPYLISPLEAIRDHYAPDVEYALGCDVFCEGEDGIAAAEDLARNSEQVILFMGIDTQIEEETKDRSSIRLPGLQNELVRRVVRAATQSVILVVITGGAIDLQEFQDDPNVAAIILAGYIGQEGGRAMADVIFGTYNPSGRVTQTFYNNEFLDQVAMNDMEMRPNAVTGNPGRTYRFYTGTPTYPFGHGLSYTTFQYRLLNQTSNGECIYIVEVGVRNSGPLVGDHSVLWFLSPPSAGQFGRPLKSLTHFDRFQNLELNEERTSRLCLKLDDFQLANENGEFEHVPGQWRLNVGDDVQVNLTVDPIT